METALKEAGVKEATIATPEKVRRKKTEKKSGLILRGLEYNGGEDPIGERTLLTTDGKGNLDLQGLSPYEYAIKQDGGASDVNIDIQLFKGRMIGITFGLPLEDWEDEEWTHLTHAALVPSHIENSGRAFREVSGGYWGMEDNGQPLNLRLHRPMEGTVHIKGTDILFTDCGGTDWRLCSKEEPLPLFQPEDKLQRETRLVIVETNMGSRRAMKKTLLAPHKNGPEDFGADYDVHALHPDRIILDADSNTVDLVIRIGIKQGVLREHIRFLFGIDRGDLGLNENSTGLRNVTLAPRRMTSDGKSFRDSMGRSWRFFEDIGGRPLAARPKKIIGDVSTGREVCLREREEGAMDTTWQLIAREKSVE